MGTPGFFFDRDGVVNEDVGPVSCISQVRLLPKIAEVLVALRKQGYLLFLVSNQSVVARAKLSLEAAKDLNAEILAQVRALDAGAYFDEVYLCPHHPHADDERYRLDCPDRKPRSGMLLRAAKKYQLDLQASVLVGDRPSDIYAAKQVGCRGVQLLGTPGAAKLIQHSFPLQRDLLRPDFQVRELGEILNLEL